MDAKCYTWADLPSDAPIPLLNRSKFEAQNMLVANVRLTKGCHVALHSHESEQVAIILSGRTRWTLGEGTGQRQIEAGEGEVVHLPANVPHGVDALEDTHIIDVLSPCGAMGIDSQRS
jgi:quercetin dioxygenase-like cupin family protein